MFDPDDGRATGPRLGRLVGRLDRSGNPTGQPGPPTGGGHAASTLLRGLAIAMALVVASVVMIAPTPAYADTNRRELVSGYSTLRADVMWASTANHQGVFLWPDNTSASQEFDLLDSGGGFFRIRARHSGQCLMLDWRAGFYDNGTPIIQFPHCSAGYTPGEWFTQEVFHKPCTGQCFGSWFVLIKNRETGMCLDAAAPSGRPAQQAVLQQWSCISATTDWNAFNQMWKIYDPTPVIIG
ncbi:RICIN domain-containing protein [Plantactinospora mayteni]|uniref:RICIN domain-containing protein n=1 Tax=Plantactinospora mayteni TaxID=566021 RepID=UPI0019444005|nr:RICIN domain-containing protein [Plantactinospora mayteni]